MEGQLIGGRYRVIRLLGKGGMGSVWLAEHITLKNEVAIKLIDSELGQLGQQRARFVREAQLAARIKSTHVVQIHDHGVTDDGQPFIAMEYLVGESLRDRLTARGRLSCAETARIVSHVGRALAGAHDAGLVHRDLKPENLFICKEGDDEIIKVLDFGVAKASDALADSSIDPTQTGVLVGTPFYMSPEQAQGLKTVDYRTDFWAMGVVVFECLTGARPFSAEALGPLIGKIMVGPIPVPSRTAPDAGLTGDVDAWVARALARDPGERFASAREMSEAFMIASGVTDSWKRSGRPSGGEGAGASKPPSQAANALADTVPLDEAAASSVAPVAQPTASSSRFPWVLAIVVLFGAVVTLGALLAFRR
jgi:serine/threonine protein kinase